MAPLLERPRAGARRASEVEAALAEELQYLPKKEHQRRETEFTERARRAERRAETGALDHALQLAGLWYRDLGVRRRRRARAGATTPTASTSSRRTLRSRPRRRCARRSALVDDTRARLALNVSEELACEALAYRLERTLT